VKSTVAEANSKKLILRIKNEIDLLQQCILKDAIFKQKSKL
jgi:hypothetical protein